MTTEKKPVFYLIDSPWVGFYRNGILTSDYAVIVDLPNDLTVSSFYDQSKGIYIKTTSSRVTVQGNPQNSCDYYYYCYRSYHSWRHVQTFSVIPVTSLCSSEYIYYAVSVNSYSSYYNSSILVVGTEDNTLTKLTVTQPVTISVCNAITHLIPYREYSFVINRLQTVYIESPNDLTGSKIVTNKEISMFSGHQLGYILHTEASYLVNQIPPTMLWGKVYYVMPIKDVPAGYALKIFAPNKCLIQISCNSSSPNLTFLNDQEFIVKSFVNNEFCTILSNSSILVVQFSLGIHRDGYSGDLLMTLVPSTKLYNNIFTFLDADNNYYPIYMYHYINIIVMAEFYQPEKIYLIAGEDSISLDTQEWIPITNNHAIEAYGTQINETYGQVEIYHTNESALMTVTLYGFTSLGSFGTPIYGHLNKGIYVAMFSLNTCMYVCRLVATSGNVSNEWL